MAHDAIPAVGIVDLSRTARAPHWLGGGGGDGSDKFCDGGGRSVGNAAASGAAGYSKECSQPRGRHQGLQRNVAQSARARGPSVAGSGIGGGFGAYYGSKGRGGLL